MTSKERLLDLNLNKQWAILVDEFSVNDICHFISFKESMVLAYDLFFENLYNDEIQDFAVRLFFAIKDTYPMEWNADWKNDVFLGKLCSITWRYDEMYELYKSAYDRLSDPPDSLLLLLASCNSAPGIPPIDNQASEVCLYKAINKKITYEAALMMRGLFSDKEDKKQEDYWTYMCTELEKNNVHTEIIIPDVLLSENRG